MKDLEMSEMDKRLEGLDANQLTLLAIEALERAGVSGQELEIIVEQVAEAMAGLGGGDKDEP